jgi:hypothetical protein
MPPRRHGNVSLCTKHARTRDRVAQTRYAETNEEMEYRLQTHAIYQTPHVVLITDAMSYVQAKEMLKAQVAYQTPHVIMVKVAL